MVHPEFIVWEWLDKQGEPFYVGYGKHIDGGPHPSEAVWAVRHEIKSDLHVYLSALKDPPQLSTKYKALMFRPAARKECFARRSRLRREGYTLLSPRPYGTTVGGGVSRIVQSPKGKKYMSVREAARAHGWNQCTITRYCATGKDGWKYLT